MACAGGVDIEPDDVTQLVDELWVVGEFKVAHPMRREAVSVPDALDGADGNASGFRHHCAGPVRGLGGRIRQRQGDDPFGHVVAKRIDARGSRLVAEKAIEAFVHETLLPTPDAGLRLPCPAHDLVRTDPFGAEQDDFGSPDMFLSGIAIADEGFEPATVARRNYDGDAGAHPTDSHDASPSGIPFRTQMSDLIH
jgi:hypothetical protein